MKRIMMHAKIHRARLTDANVDYAGSITLDPALMDAAGILEFEQVHVVDVDNGSRFTTYTIAGEPGSGQVIVNGAAARLVTKGDRVIVIAYAEVEDAEAVSWKPRVVQVDEANLPLSPGSARRPNAANPGHPRFATYEPPTEQSEGAVAESAERLEGAGIADAAGS
jgi:aspartate 1-decarboxylase